MALATLLKLIHILIAIWFIAGLLGRTFALRQAARSDDINSTVALVQLAGRFESLMVIPGSFAVVLAGLFTAWGQGWPILGFLQGGSSNWVLVSVLLYIATIPIIPLVFLPKGRVFERALLDAKAKGSVTPELQMAFADRAVAVARNYEAITVLLIVVLMVLKPF